MLQCPVYSACSVVPMYYDVPVWCSVQSILPALLSQCIIVFCPVQYVCSGFPANYIVPVYHVVPVDYVVQYSLLCLLCCPNALCCMLCCSIVPVDYVVPICLVQSVVSPPLSHCIMLPKIFCCPNVFCCPGVFYYINGCFPTGN